MRSALQNAISRRDDRLNRVRQLTFWLAGGATAASVGLAGVLGVAIPGRTTSATGHPATGQAGTGTGSSGTGSKGGPAAGAGLGGRHHPRKLVPPPQPPSGGGSPGSGGGAPVVSSGGS
jgi:hypothetical protein